MKWFIALVAAVVLTGCASGPIIGRYNNQITPNLFATNTSYVYGNNGNMVGYINSYKR